MKDARFSDDAADLRPSAKALRFALATLMAGAIVSMAELYQTVHDSGGRYIGPALIALLALLCWWLVNQGKRRLAMQWLALGLWVITVAIAVSGGGLRTPVVVAFPVIIILVGWLFGARSTLVVGGLTALVLCGLWWGEAAGLLPDAPVRDTALYAVVQVVLTVMAVFLINFLVRNYSAPSEGRRDTLSNSERQLTAMQPSPSLSQLSHAQKDELIVQLQEQIAALQKIVEQLQSRLNINSRNSSKPPSSDGLNKPAPKSLRIAGQRPVGGQKGHLGNTLRQASVPDKVIVHNTPEHCQACHSKLPFAYVAETRQVFDLPTLQFEVTEHHAMQAICNCGQVHTGEFPAEVRASVQYGSGAQAAMVHLNQNHAVSIQRTAALMQELFGLQVSQASVVHATRSGAERLLPTVQAIGQAMLNTGVLHADESGLRVAKKLHWLHVLATDTLTWMGVHPKRGSEAFESLALLQQFRGVLVHDGWMPYKALPCQHALCNAHHLRELTYLLEEQGQDWAGDMIALLTHANHSDNLNCVDGQQPGYEAKQYQNQVRDLRHLYDAILTFAETQNPMATSRGKRGRPKQSKATNLIGRLRDYSDDVWRFMTQADVPFTNNLAEQTVRMPKVKQKVSGCFRTIQGAQTYCLIRSYCATMHKQGANVFEALVATFKGQPPQPSFA